MGPGNWSLSLTIKSIAFSALLISGPAPSQGSELEVLGTVGPVISTNAYYDVIDWEDIFTQMSDALSELENIQVTLNEDVFFPLKTQMAPGRLSSKEFAEPRNIPQPFAVVGTDNLSLEWLRQRYDDLVNFEALVYVVEAESFDMLIELKNAFPGLAFGPGNGDGIARILLVERYPFMVNNDGVWQ